MTIMNYDERVFASNDPMLVEGEEICSVRCEGYPECCEEGGNCTFPDKAPTYGKKIKHLSECACGHLCGDACRCLEK